MINLYNSERLLPAPLYSELIMLRNFKAELLVWKNDVEATSEQKSYCYVRSQSFDEANWSMSEGYHWLLGICAPQRHSYV